MVATEQSLVERARLTSEEQSSICFAVYELFTTEPKQIKDGLGLARMLDAQRAKVFYAVVDSLREEGDTWNQPSKDAIHTVANTLERELEAAGLERPA